MTHPFDATLAAWPTQAQLQFYQMRAVILDAARGVDVGPVDESLKWGQPAWRPRRPRTGSTLRLSWQDNVPHTIALFVDCKSTISATMQDIYPHDFLYESNRGLRLRLGEPLPEQAIDHLARLTFTYHLTS